MAQFQHGDLVNGLRRYSYPQLAVSRLYPVMKISLHRYPPLPAFFAAVMQHFAQNPSSHGGQKYPIPAILFTSSSGLPTPLNEGLLVTLFPQLLHLIYFSSLCKSYSSNALI
jgi:hypothetical protein